MPAASQEDQFKFLISCIRYSNNGKVDFAEVAKECQIVSKGAAAKRYERMMKFHGLYQPASGVRETFKSGDSKEEENSPAPTTPVKKAAETPVKNHSSPKKRARKSLKGFDDESGNLAMDDDEELVHTSPKKIKTEKDSHPVIKEEPQAGHHGTAGLQYPLAEEGAGADGEACGDVLSDFLQPEDFETQNEPDGDAFARYGHEFP